MATLLPPASSRMPPSTPRSTELTAVRVSTVALERRGLAHRQRLGNTIVGRADDAADRRRAVTQRRGAAHDFDLIGRQRIDRHEMIFTEIGGAAAVGAVFDDSDAIDIETPDDRPAGGPRRKARTGNAGLGKQEIAELGAALATDFLVRYYGDGCELIGHDRQHALLGRGSDRCRLRLRRALAVAGGSGAGHACRRSRRNGPVSHDRARRGHGDFGQLRGGGWRRGRVLGHRAVGNSAQQQPARSTEIGCSSSRGFHCRVLTPSKCDGSIWISLGDRLTGASWRGRSNQSMSGVRRRAGLERGMYRVQMDELGVGRPVKKFDGLRQQQHRWS
jgi:hypothetical protein